MIIAIDASRAVRPQPTGTELYSARIIEYLTKLDQENTYYLYSPTPPPANFPQLPDNCHWKIIPFPRLWTQIRLSLALMIDRPDILFVPAHTMPLFAPAKTVVTLHDLAYEIFPEAYSPFARWHQRFSTSQSAKRATAIIVPSEASKQDLIKLNNAPADKITVIHHGFDAPSGKVAVPDKITQLQPFFLSIGRLETRKNTARIIEAFGQLRQQQPDLTIKLVLIGKPGHGYEQVLAAKAALPPKIARDVIETGYVDDETVAAYRQAATAFVYPSLYEGFGLALLEAMAVGLPVITSDSSSLPEVADDAAILVDPASTDELAHAMKVLATNDLSGEQIAARGKERVKDFSWEKSAAATLKAIQQVAKER